MQSKYDRIQFYTFGLKQKASLVAKAKTLLAKDGKVKSAWLFGSITRSGRVRDVDVAIHAEPELTFKEYLNLNAELELELKMPVDLVEIGKVALTLKDSILKNSIRLL
jgi:predicted nucleotidyltransferase